ncbi:MAG: PSD1 and planctomycete cytochrome C domain-containing protein [Verrucomicrobiota bacterium]
MSAGRAGEISYNRDVRPILSNHCFACHGPDENDREAGVRLDVFEAATAPPSGGLDSAPIVPGKPDASEMIARIEASDPADRMPPSEFLHRIDREEAAILRKWIEEGAKYEEHWSYLPVKRPKAPRATGFFIRNEIDAFVWDRLREEGIEPSKPAGRRRLARRLALDLTGLPLEPNRLEWFLAGNGESSFDALVDDLLASPHFGERMAVPWLDVVRFADTVGYHGDQPMNVFPYRDYVINAFNANKPFNQFVIEQVAGDLLENPTTEQLVATGFNRLNMVTREGGAQPKEYIAKYNADRVRTIGTAFLGSTLACAECHDHKFDPFSIRDFYRMAAFFADVKQWGVYSNYRSAPNPELEGWTNEHPFPPEIRVDSPFLKGRSAKLESELGELLLKVDGKPMSAWRGEMERFLAGSPTGWEVAGITEVKSSKGSPTRLEGKEVLVIRDKVKMKGEEKHAIVLESGESSTLAAFRIELLPHYEHGGKVTRNGLEEFSLRAELKRNGEVVPVVFADADRARQQYALGSEVRNLKKGWKSRKADARLRHEAVFQLRDPIPLEANDRLEIQISSSGVGCLRVSLSPIARHSFDESPELDALNFVSSAVEVKEFRSEAHRLREAIDGLGGGKAWTLVTMAAEPREIRVLPRGNWQDDSGELLSPGVPEFLPPIANESGRRLTRLDLAHWLVSRENPLTARTFVNRVWQQFFGRGLAPVLDDLGSQGGWPEHGELLDWLTAEFMESDWDVKHLVRTIVTSSTYRQSSQGSPELIDRDPYNSLLARQTPRRLDAEFVRDHALAVSGLLNRSLGGPSAFPYQPPGYYTPLNFPVRSYEASVGEDQYRRGIYTHWQRTFFHPMMANFDAPSRDECTAERVTSNTPQQALTLLNDPTFVEAAAHFALRAWNEGAQTFDGALDAMFRRALGRPSTQREWNRLFALYESRRGHYTKNDDELVALFSAGQSRIDPGEQSPRLAALTQVARVVLNLHESITRY